MRRSHRARGEILLSSLRLRRILELLLGIVVLSFAGAAWSSQIASESDDFAGLESDRIELISQDECERDFVRPITSWGFVSNWRQHFQDAKYAYLMSSEAQSEKASTVESSARFTPWTPTAMPKHLEPAGCDPATISADLFASSGSTRQQAAKIREFFVRCDVRLRRDGSNSLMALINLQSSRYQLCDQPQVRKLKLRLDNGDYVRGFLALKPGASPRPLVIVKCGAFCHSNDPAQRALLMHLFDESPFHVLTLASVTGPDFVLDNRYITIGGLHEGQHLILAAKLMRESALAGRISRVHAMTVSLGSHAGLFAATMNDAIRASGGASAAPLTSVLTACPVVDLRTSIRDVFTKTILNRVARSLFDSSAAYILTRDPSLRPLFPDPSIANAEVPNAMAATASHHFSSLSPGWTLAPYQDRRVRDADDFWDQNQFASIAEKTAVLTPTLAFAGDDDMVVDTAANTRLLENALLKLKKADPLQAEMNQLATARIPSGNHCAFNQFYGWRTISALYRSYFLSRSPEMIARQRVRALSFALSADIRLRPNERYYMPRFTFAAGSDKLLLEMRIFTGPRWAFGCTEVASDSGAQCFRDVKMEIPISSLAGEWARIPRTTPEAEALTRWANVNLRMIDEHGVRVEDSRRPVAAIEWTSYE